jgi:hypothetical protein
MISATDCLVGDFDHLNADPRLAPRRSGGQRTVDMGARVDAVTDVFARCETPADLARLGCRFALTREEVLAKAERATGFGQFRMALGNRIRGICRRLELAQRRGREMSLLEAAYPKSRRCR